MTAIVIILSNIFDGFPPSKMERLAGNDTEAFWQITEKRMFSSALTYELLTELGAADASTVIRE